MRPLRWLGGWLSDWRTGAMLLGSVVIGLVIAIVITSGINTHDAITARNRTATAAASRIDKLTARINELGAQLVHQAETNGTHIGELTVQIEALEEQIRQMGGKPVVEVVPSPGTSAPTTSTTQPRNSTPPTTAPSTTTTTTTPPRSCVLILCG